MAKFTEELYIDDYEVLTPEGWKDFKGVGKTIPYKKYKVKTQNFEIECADNHLIETIDGFKYAKELKNDLILTKQGYEKVISIIDTKNKEVMFDLIGVDGKKYYTNGISSHNTTFYQVYVTFFIMFQQKTKPKTVIILANKEKLAKDILKRIKTAFRQLPKWLQTGVTQWNELSIELENGCTVHALSTSSDAARGMSSSLLIIDESLYGESIITVQDKETGKVKQITMNELYDELYDEL